MATALPACMKITAGDTRMLLACQTHLGSTNVETSMTPYVYKRRPDGVHIIDLAKTWDKLMFAARVIAAIENPADIVVVSTRTYGQRASLKFARYIGAQAISGRYTPGTFTNQIQRQYVEPRILVATDPRTDHQAIREASFCNLPVIAFCDTDSPLRNVDIAIPCNNKARLSVGLMYWLLTREVLRIRGEIPRNKPWEVMPDLFFHREIEHTTPDSEGADPTALAAAASADDAKLNATADSDAAAIAAPASADAGVPDWAAADLTNAAPVPVAVPAGDTWEATEPQTGQAW